MSRIGKQLISIPEGVELKLDGNHLEVKGKKGTLKRELHATMSLLVDKTAKTATVAPKSKAGDHGNFHGLTRSLVYNMIEGVSQGFTKSLKLVGVGYKAILKGKELNLTLGFSHPIVYSLPVGFYLQSIYLKKKIKKN